MSLLWAAGLHETENLMLQYSQLVTPSTRIERMRIFSVRGVIHAAGLHFPDMHSPSTG